MFKPIQKGKKSTVESIQNIAKVLQPEVSTTEVVDEWKLFQVDNNLPHYNPSERIEVFWNAVFELHSVDGSMRYKVLPSVIKSALVLAQTNAESEWSLSVNARIVTQERASLGEKTIIGLHIVKEAVKFFDPVSNRPEMIPITEDLKKSVRSAHSAYKAHLEEEKEMAERKKEEARKEKEMSEKAQKEKERLIEKKKSLAMSEEDLNKQEDKAREDLKAADELLNDATTKLQDALSGESLNKNSIAVAQMMLETAKAKCTEIMDHLADIRQKQKSLEKTTHKLLDQALPSKESDNKKRKSEGEEKSGKRKLKSD